MIFPLFPLLTLLEVEFSKIFCLTVFQMSVLSVIHDDSGYDINQSFSQDELFSIY